LALALSLSCCGFAPDPVLRYRTADERGDSWSNGLRLHHAAAKRFAFTTAFLECARDPRGYAGPRLLQFRIVAVNPSDGAESIDPADFRVAVPAKGGAPGKGSLWAAIDPEAMILQARKDRAAEETRFASDGIAHGVVALSGSISDIGSAFAFQTPEERKRAREEEKQRREDEAYSQAQHDKNMADASSLEAFWSGALRKTTLTPGMAAQGRVSFALEDRVFSPDTLRLQYRNADGSVSDLGDYGLVRDADSAAKAVPAADPAPFQNPRGDPPKKTYKLHDFTP
jgi:hypothetical protein